MSLSKKRRVIHETVRIMASLEHEKNKEIFTTLLEDIPEEEKEILTFLMKTFRSLMVTAQKEIKKFDNFFNENDTENHRLSEWIFDCAKALKYYLDYIIDKYDIYIEESLEAL